MVSIDYVCVGTSFTGYDIKYQLQLLVFHIPSYRILSSQSRSLDEALSCLLAPVMDMITTASIRVYLAQDYLQNALQLLLSILQMVVGQDTANRGTLVLLE